MAYFVRTFRYCVRHHEDVAFSSGTARRAYERDEEDLWIRETVPKRCIQVRVDLPDYTDLQQVKYNWTSIYGDISEELPKDMPVPRGKHDGCV